MARRVTRWILCLLLPFLLVGCSAEGSTERFGHLYTAIRSQPEIQPPPDYVPPTTAAIGGDPIAKADVVVFATRPGDATVSAYATIRQAVAQGKRVVIVFVTDGDAQTVVARELADLPADATPTPRQYLHGAAVLQEMAMKVAESSFGLAWEDVIFLSYPDGILHQLVEESPDQAIRSPFTEKDGVHDPNVTPYRILRTGYGFPYAFNFALRDLNDVLVELNPREIYFPSPDSEDETVAAAGRLIVRSLREVALPAARVLVYSQQADTRRPPDQRVHVTAPEEKQDALSMYAERIGIADWPELPAALLEEELFWEFDYTDAH